MCVCELGARSSETPQCPGARGTSSPRCQLAKQSHGQHPSTVMEASLCLLRPPTRTKLKEEKIKEDKNSLKVKNPSRGKKKTKNLPVHVCLQCNSQDTSPFARGRWGVLGVPDWGADAVAVAEAEEVWQVTQVPRSLSTRCPR